MSMSLLAAKTTNDNPCERSAERECCLITSCSLCLRLSSLGHRRDASGVNDRGHRCWSVLYLSNTISSPLTISVPDPNTAKYLSLNRFDCRPIRDAEMKTHRCVNESRWRRESVDKPSMDMPTWTHFLNRHARHVIFDVDRISQMLLSAQRYRSGAFSFIDRRKNPFTRHCIDSISFFSPLLCMPHKLLHQNEFPTMDHRTLNTVIYCISPLFWVRGFLQMPFASIDKKREAVLPWGFIPTVRHFWNRQCWHCVRDRLVMAQEKSRWHLYFLLPSPVEIERRKNFCNGNETIDEISMMSTMYFACFTCDRSKVMKWKMKEESERTNLPAMPARGEISTNLTMFVVSQIRRDESERTARWLLLLEHRGDHWLMLIERMQILNGMIIVRICWTVRVPSGGHRHLRTT